MSRAEPNVSTAVEGGVLRLAPVGPWTARSVGLLDERLAAIDVPAGVTTARIDLSGIDALDTAGAWLLHRTMRGLARDGVSTTFVSTRRRDQILLEEIADSERAPAVPPKGPSAAETLVTDTGVSVIWAGRDFMSFFTLLGSIVISLAYLLRHPTRLRMTSITFHFEQICMRAAPIVIMISLAIGAIIAQQSIFQLRNFGAESLSVVFIGIVVLRELGVLLTAIMVAGRSGSAITAEIGAMKMREEIDAMRTLAIDPLEVLIVPRIIALILAMPLLTFIANMSGLVAASLVSWGYMGMPINLFFESLRDQVAIENFWRGLMKAPFMALAIGIIAFIEGFKVAGSTESLGRHTTSSVVKSIFLVILMAGLFAVYFAYVDD